MATLGQGDQGVVELTFKASEVMANLYVAVKLDTSNQGHVSLAADGERAIGILKSTADAAEVAVRVQVAGTTLVKAYTTFAIGAHLNSGDTTGKLATKGSTEHAIAVALEAATALDNEVLALIQPYYV